METTEAKLDDVERELLSWAGRVAAGEAKLLELIGEFDAREGWAASGALSCAHWLMWKLGYGIVASRERVRVARLLRDLPMTAKSMGTGELSYTQVRAITRVATADDEQTWIDLAQVTTSDQLQKAVNGVTRARKPAADANDPDQAEWRDRPRVSWDQDGTLVLTFRIRPALAPGVMASLEQAMALEQSEREAKVSEIAAELASPDASQEAPPERYVYVEPPYPGLQHLGRIPSDKPAGLDAAMAAYREEKQRRRDKAEAWKAYEQALLLEAEKRGALTRKATLTDGFMRLLQENVGTVKVGLMIDPMSGWVRTTKDDFLPPVIAAELLKGQPLPRIRPITLEDIERLDQGRTTRLVTPAQRRMIGLLDGERCRFPSCNRTRNLHAHHLTFWRDGGRTDLANLGLFCSRHHTVIHEQGFELSLLRDRTLVITTKEGVRLEHLQPLPWGDGEALDGKPPESRWNGDRLDLGHVAWVLAQHAA
ncbi:MAG: endonuclease [Mycobacterium sp.]|nr:endonuclease [Mycobacterium sp.]